MPPPRLLRVRGDGEPVRAPAVVRAASRDLRRGRPVVVPVREIFPRQSHVEDVLLLALDRSPGAHQRLQRDVPSSDDDVITSPYNTVLALHELQQHAHCVLPIENQALLEICRRASAAAGGSPSARSRRHRTGTLSPRSPEPRSELRSAVVSPASASLSSAGGAGAGAAPRHASAGETTPFDAMNSVAAQLLGLSFREI